MLSCRLLFSASTLLLLGACASMPAPTAMPSTADLFADSSFHPPRQRFDVNQLFALSAPMQDYLHSARFDALLHGAAREQGLFDALYKEGELKLDYDAALTRDAAGTYAARKGNCLSLVIMTAAFAKALGLEVNFQTVLVAPQWSRAGALQVVTSHVNLNLPYQSQTPSTDGKRSALTIDFLESREADAYAIRPIAEATIVAMYLNNRAAEELAVQDLDEAYWWARQAVERHPSFTMAYNTLGVVYQRHGDLALAERVFKRALERESEDVTVMHNLVPVLQAQGKAAEAEALRKRVAGIDPAPAFHFFLKGVKAMDAQDYDTARSLFAREVARSPYYHEFHFWLALAEWRLGHARAAEQEMELARRTSSSDGSTRLYASKLAYLRSRQSTATSINPL